MTHSEVLTFWFEQCEPKDWWQKNHDFDVMIQQRFGLLQQAASQGELFQWRECAEGRLAEVIVLDQFSRNIFRDQPAAFACDSMALALSQEAIRQGADCDLTEQQRLFLYMPFMHSESKVIHEQAMHLFEQLGLESNLEFERKHKAIIDRFGRYPHRNDILGRRSSAEELAFLKQPGSSF